MPSSRQPVAAAPSGPSAAGAAAPRVNRVMLACDSCGRARPMRFLMLMAAVMAASVLFVVSLGSILRIVLAQVEVSASALQLAPTIAMFAVLIEASTQVFMVAVILASASVFPDRLTFGSRYTVHEESGWRALRAGRWAHAARDAMVPLTGVVTTLVLVVGSVLGGTWEAGAGRDAPAEADAVLISGAHFVFGWFPLGVGVALAGFISVAMLALVVARAGALLLAAATPCWRRRRAAARASAAVTSTAAAAVAVEVTLNPMGRAERGAVAPAPPPSLAVDVQHSVPSERAVVAPRAAVADAAQLARYFLVPRWRHFYTNGGVLLLLHSCALLAAAIVIIAVAASGPGDAPLSRGVAGACLAGALLLLGGSVALCGGWWWVQVRDDVARAACAAPACCCICIDAGAGHRGVTCVTCLGAVCTVMQADVAASTLPAGPVSAGLAAGAATLDELGRSPWLVGTGDDARGSAGGSLAGADITSVGVGTASHSTTGANHHHGRGHAEHDDAWKSLWTAAASPPQLPSRRRAACLSALRLAISAAIAGYAAALLICCAMLPADTTRSAAALATLLAVCMAVNLFFPQPREGCCSITWRLTLALSAVTVLVMGSVYGAAVGDAAGFNATASGHATRGPSGWPACAAVVNGLTLTEHCLLSAATYGDADAVATAFETWFPAGRSALQPNGTWTLALNAPDGPRQGHIAVAARGSSAGGAGAPRLALFFRGTSSLGDWLTDADVWAATAVLQLSMALSPTALLPAAALRAAVGLTSAPLDLLTTGNAAPRLPAAVTAALNVTDSAVAAWTHGAGGTVSLSGHSLGGGVAALAAALRNVSSVSLSGPGFLLTSGKLGAAAFPGGYADAAARAGLETAIVPDYDLVARVDVHGGAVQRIACGVNGPVECHSALRSCCELLRACGDELGRSLEPAAMGGAPFC